MKFHILNGDSLLHQFPESILGKKLIARECLIEGPIQSKYLDQFYKDRAAFLESEFGEDILYKEKSQSQFDQILLAPEGSEFYLWFEDDLFCQTNFWFCLHLIQLNKKIDSVFWVRPKKGFEFGFSGMNQTDFEQAFLIKKFITKADLSLFSKLWTAYQDGNQDLMEECASLLTVHFPQVLTAVHHNKDKEERVRLLLLEIIYELGSNEFVPVFKRFCTLAPEYGFGDSQILSRLKKL